MVSTVAWREPGAVHCHQTECPPVLPAWLGSPDSLVAPALLPVALAELPVSLLALAKLSLAGLATAAVKWKVMLPVAPPKPSTAMRYVVPAVAVKAARLVWLPPESSSLAMVVRLLTEDPV